VRDEFPSAIHYRFCLVRQLPAKAGGGFELTEY